MTYNFTSNLADTSFFSIQYLEQSLRLYQPRRVTYFYFDYAVKKSAVDLLASLLKQLASQLEDVPQCLKTLYQTYKPETPRPDQTKLLEFFVQCAEMYPEAYVFLDAFDECDPKLRKDVVSIVKRLHKAKIKVYVTTQPGGLEDLATDGLNDAVKAEIRAKEPDVRSYVMARLHDDIEPKLRTKIINTISSGVDGMYETEITSTNDQISTRKSTAGCRPSRGVCSTHEVAIK
jgi:hypothetical protein